MADPLSITASCVGILSFGLSVTHSVLEFYQTVRSSRRDVQSLCESVEAIHRILDTVRKTIERHGVQDNAAAVFDHIKACRAGLDRLTKKLDKIRQGMSQKGLRSVASTLQYPFRESTIAKLKEIVTMDLMNNLSMAITVLNLDVSNLNHRAVLSDLSSTNSSLNSMRRETQSNFANVQHTVSNITTTMAAHQIEDRRDKILRWIAPSDFVAETHIGACKQREPQTGNWFLQDLRYQEWKNRPGTVLWLYGIPGCGKSILR